MRLANVGGRATVLIGAEGETGADVAGVSGGRFGPDLAGIYEDWATFRAWADDAEASGALAAAAAPVDVAALGSPAPAPRQVFAIGLNYRSHAEESGMALPAVPATFTKYPASLSGPFDPIVIDVASADWEVELVAVIGTRAEGVAEADGWAHIAGLAIGQDISDRALQFAAGAQFSLRQSRPGYGPIGPWLVTPDALTDPDDLAIGCSVDGETVQDARTSDLVFSVPRLVAELSGVLPLLPGDVIFTGTPAGVGFTRQPARALQPGHVLESWIEGIGTIRNTCVGPA